KNPEDFFSFLQTQGYLRVWLYGKLIRTDESPKPASLPGRVEVVQDRIEITPANRARLQEAIETALRFGKGHATLIEPETHTRHPHSAGWHCAHCDLEIRPPTPGLFSFNNPLGACPECRGFGRVIGIDYDRALPDRSLSIADGVVKPFQTGFSRECQDDLLKHCRERGIDAGVPFEDLPKRDQKFVIEGEGKPDISSDELWSEGKWYGVKGYFDWMESKAYKMHVRVLLSRYRSYRLCPACNGGRFQPQTLAYKLVGADGSRKPLPDIAMMPIRDLEPFFDRLPLDANDPSVELLRHQVNSRLHYLNEVGLGYLTLDRPTRTLSGGEIERVNLTSCLGASLVNTLFVMDEPSVGLHPRDTRKLVEIMHRLRNKGNTLLVVEHEEAVIRSADYLVDIGPGRGAQGGEIVFAGPAADIATQPQSLTAQYLTGEKTIPIPAKRRKPHEWVEFNGIEHHNLHRLSVKIPLGIFCAITGVSGSGKSSLVRDVIFRNLDFNPAAEGEAPGHVREMDGGERVEEVLLVDQSPLARSPRSTPALYLGVFDKIRELFGMGKEAISAGLTPSSFSFNSGNGRCERCGGLGFEKIEMQFLSDLFLRCPECDGRRYRSHVLAILLDGKSIHDVLEMTVREAIEFFAQKETRGEITGPLKLMSEVGLDYLRIGQPVNVLSGGESQRLKLVHRLVTQKQAGGSMLIFDEPTTGLHFDDIALLLKVFQRLVNEGHSLLVIEHNLEVIKSADWVIDLGPEAGDQGGQVVATGTPEQVAQAAASHTGRFLAEVLGGAAKPVLHSEIRNPKSEIANVISVRGAREHNLKNISVDIPRDEMVVITGLSGSGKSTLAFDILFAEGQRRFLDSMSPYARQFVEQLEKPEVDHVDGLPPSVAIEQRVTRGGGKSTVATVTEIYHFLRLLFAKLGTQHCPDCRVAVESNSLSAVLDVVRQLAVKGRLQIFAPLVRGRKGFHTEVARWADRQGFEYLLVDGKLTRVDGFQKLERFKEHTIDVLVGEILSGKQKDAEGLLKRALEIGKGTAKALDSKHKFHILSTEMNCPGCGRAFEELDPRLFSFNSPHGWCAHCRGFGEVWNNPAEKGGQFETQLEADLDEESRYEKLEEGEASACPICHGERLNEVARSVFLQGKTISNLTGAQASQAHTIIRGLKFKGTQQEIARDVIEEILQRLNFLN
ncbi:MAG TPA: excinuclease ABC subunit UvrA, partial [Chthoniobacterales bacterium]